MLKCLALFRQSHTGNLTSNWRLTRGVIGLLVMCLLAACPVQLGCRERATGNTAKPNAVKTVKPIAINKVKPIAMLDEQLRSRFRGELKRDPAKEFEPEFIRTTDLERDLIDKYGFDAITLIFEDRNSANYFLLEEFPADCPWANLNDCDIEVAIDTLFAPIASEVPRLTAALKERCTYLYAEKLGETWTLHYFLDIVLYDGRRYYLIYSGGEPSPIPDVNASLAKYQWNIPNDLKRLYAIHDGFGPILDSSEITVMAQMMDPICKEQNTYPDGYNFADLLEFHPDGAGNAQCFHRQGKRNPTVDWDHEVWEISEEQEFFDYLDERLSQLDEE